MWKRIMRKNEVKREKTRNEEIRSKQRQGGSEMARDFSINPSFSKMNENESNSGISGK